MGDGGRAYDTDEMLLCGLDGRFPQAAEVGSTRRNKVPVYSVLGTLVLDEFVVFLGS